MIKVLIVVSGLLLFVPDGGDDPLGLTALLRETVPVEGHHAVDVHDPLLQQVGASPLTTAREPFDITFRVLLPRDVPVTNRMASIDLGGLKDVPDLGDLTARPADGEVVDDCLVGRCVDEHGHQKVLGVARFEGGWRTRPLLRCDRQWKRPVDFQDRLEFDFRRRSNVAPAAARPGVPRRRLASGLALEAQVTTLDDLQIVWRGRLQPPMRPTPPDECRQWLGDGSTPCVVIELENWPKVDPDTRDCRNLGTAPIRCRLDEHFAALYDLTIEGGNDGDPYLPFAAYAPDDDLACAPPTGSGNPPAVRCPPAKTKPRTRLRP